MKYQVRATWYAAFDEEFDSLAEAEAWALRTLKNHPTAAIVIEGPQFNGTWFASTASTREAVPSLSGTEA